jgi:hypothetical protein
MSGEARFLKALFAGRAGYMLIKEFRTPTVVPGGLPLNPTIVVFKVVSFASSLPPSVSFEAY